MLIKNKKGTELGMNTIVMAVIAIAVLVVVIIVFANKFGLFSSELNNCENTGKGKCIPDGSKCSSDYQGRLMDYKCKTTGDVCCVGACNLAGGTCTTKTCSEDKLLYATCPNLNYCCRS
jgi:hypothetical protein